MGLQFCNEARGGQKPNAAVDYRFRVCALKDIFLEEEFLIEYNPTKRKEKHENSNEEDTDKTAVKTVIIMRTLKSQTEKKH